MSSSNQAIVINDLLSFFSCKVNDDVPRSKLIKSIREYYSEGVVLKAQKILLESVPVKKSTRHHRRLKHPDPLEAMYETFQLIPSEDLPIFVCRNLNNVPHLEHYPGKEVIKEEILDERELTIEEEYENSHQDIKDEQLAMKSQIADITDVVKQIKDQLKHIVQQQPSPSKPNNLSINSTKRRKSYLKSSSNPNKKFNALPIEPPSLKLKKNPKTSMAYIQKLIDEEAADVKSESQYEDSQKDDYSDYLDELSEDEEKFVQSACEVVLQENLEGLDQINLLKGTPVKMQGEKIIYIKNEEEDFDFDNYSELQMDDENSIEISSADHFSSFDEIDSSNRIGGADPVIIVSHCSTENYENDIIFTCSGCNLSSRNRVIFNGHKCNIKTSRKSKKSRAGFVCSVCEFETMEVIQFNEHMLAHYDLIPEEGYECILCIFKSNNYDEYRAHLSEHSWKRPYRCDACSYKCSKEIRFKNHLIRHLECKGPNHFECIICGKICGTRNTMEKHKQMHKRNFDFKCEYCGITFRHRSALSQHILLSHTKERTFVCSICNCLYDSQHSLDIHMKVHFKDNFFTCHVCGEKIKSKTTFRNHILTQHADVKAFKCEHCSEAFTFKHTLLMHRKRHENQLFSCPHCNKKFKCANYLKIHCAIHEGKKPYKCTHCEFESNAKVELKKHLAVHDEPYVVSCPNCAFLTEDMAELDRHKLSHEGPMKEESFIDQVMVVMTE